MKDLYPIISGLSTNDARAALYYLCRYIKQGAIQEAYGKDIFDDDQKSRPSDLVRDATLKLIAAMEAAEGKPASEFDNEAFYYWIDHTFDIENSLDRQISEDEAARAAKFLREMQSPRTETGWKETGQQSNGDPF